jgi:double zinc ribbon protein
MNCTQCGAALPPNARFCYACGAPAYNPAAPGAPPPPPPPPPATAGTVTTAAGGPTIAPAGAQAIKCPNCGAPVHPTFGDMVITCDYCGSSVTLGGAGWKQIQKHTMLVAKMTSRDDALKLVQAFMDQGFLHRRAFEDSKIVEEKLSYVPFWIVPVAATTTYTYQDVAVSVGSTVATMAASELLGSALTGNRGTVVPIMTGPVVNPTRSATLSSNLEFPVVAAKGMTAYQPRNYAFNLTDRAIFDRKKIPDGAPVLNGDIGEDAAQHAAQVYVTQLQAEQAHRAHRMVSALKTDLQLSEAELLHVPIFYFLLEHKGARQPMLVDAQAARIMPTGGP